MFIQTPSHGQACQRQRQIRSPLQPSVARTSRVLSVAIAWVIAPDHALSSECVRSSEDEAWRFCSACLLSAASRSSPRRASAPFVLVPPMCADRPCHTATPTCATSSHREQWSQPQPQRDERRTAAAARRQSRAEKGEREPRPAPIHRIQGTHSGAGRPTATRTDGRRALPLTRGPTPVACVCCCCCVRSLVVVEPRAALRTKHHSAERAAVNYLPSVVPFADASPSRARADEHRLERRGGQRDGGGGIRSAAATYDAGGAHST